jgi:hypothetical protein
MVELSIVCNITSGYEALSEDFVREFEDASPEEIMAHTAHTGSF